jgi:serine/threonine-protein kinase
MGKVWAARSLGARPNQRLVAIKTALAEELASADFQRLFLDEARIASLIQHPNVCAIHGLDEERGVIYLVMDWSDGASLRELLDAVPEHRLPHTLAVRIIAHVCAGLHAAHELEGDDGKPLGVVHRDVSPQNVLISARGHVKITDFGVAKARGQLHRPTETGEMKGKLSYMAPEQVTTKDVDRRVDIFALGCVLYEATVGKRPFHGDDALATLYQLLEQPILPPGAVLTGYPPALERIVVRALAKDPKDRYQTAEEMAQALEAWLASTRTIVNETQVSETLRAALGERVEARTRLIHETTARLDAAQTPQPAADTNAPAKDSSVPTSESASTARSVHEAKREGAARALRWALVAASLVAMAGLVVVATGAGRSKASPGAGKPERVVANVTPTESEPERVVITVKTEPPDAVIRIDEGPPLVSPYRATVQPDQRDRTLLASAPGYEDRTQRVRFDQTKEIVLVLPKLLATTPVREKPDRQAPRVYAPSPTPTPRATPVETVTPPTGPGELPMVKKKKPRSLDPDNPFASKE